MANVDENLLLPNKWIDEIKESSVDEETGEFLESLAAKRLWYLCLSGIEGKKVSSGDPAVDYWLLGYIARIQEMKQSAKKARMPKEEKDNLIYELAIMGKKSNEIAKEIYGKESSSSTVRKNPGWQKAQQELVILKKCEKNEEV